MSSGHRIPTLQRINGSQLGADKEADADVPPPQPSHADAIHGLTADEITSLCNEAVAAKEKAYCPYSNFRVGCALLLTDPIDTTPQHSSTTSESQKQPVGVGTHFRAHNTAAGDLQHEHQQQQHQQHQQPSRQHYIHGANMENASYPVGQCAERSALGAAITSYGIPPRGGIKAVGVSSDVVPPQEPTSPCGMCRQALREFCGSEVPVFMVDAEGNRLVRTMGELLPHSFGSDALLGAGAPSRGG